MLLQVGTILNIKVYANAASVLALVVADVAMFLVFEILWFDSVCTTLTIVDESAELSETGEAEEIVVDHQVRGDIIALKTIVALCYLVKIWTIFEKTARVKNARSLCARPFWALWTFLIIVLFGIALIIAESVECVKSDESYFGTDHIEALQRLKVAVHLMRVVLAWNILIMRLKKTFRRKLQTAVSQNRRRFFDTYGDFDIDLTYVCDRLLAMSLPCVGGAFYRNDIREVSRFFATFHYGSFMVVNLCESQEESGNGNYDPSYLYHQVRKFPMRDHNICSLRTLV